MRKRCSVQPASLADDVYLDPYRDILKRRAAFVSQQEARITSGHASLEDVAAGHTYFGLHRCTDGWVFREWAPNATSISLSGTFSDWQERPEYALRRLNDHGEWELRLPADALHHGDLYHLLIRWPGGEGKRIPAYARRVVQDEHTHLFCAQVWDPEIAYAWKHVSPPHVPGQVLIYEAHVGMAQDRAGVGTYEEFRLTILPRIREGGYNTIQLMAVAEHPYYGSFGYHVSSFFAASSRFGTPEELKGLIDEAHGMGLRVIIDLVHSHGVKNEVEGLSCFDGTRYQYFHDSARGDHPAWDSRCFDYGKPEILHFLLSNCRFWLDEYRVDGFRFDGVTSMLYHHRGLGTAFTSYERYFDGNVDEDAVAYLTLANRLIHTLRPDAVTVAEDVSGFAGLGAAEQDGGIGFDYRLAMGIPDFWFRLVQEHRDEDWKPAWMWSELTNRRADERTISYVECHDQAIVGSKTLIFELIDAAMYDHMHVQDDSPVVQRGIALHKMIRLLTLATSGHGYLNFMGNEFGHPEWIDFPREGNNWSYHFAQRQWHLRDDKALKYQFLAEFDRVAVSLFSEHDLLRHDLRLLQTEENLQILVFERGGFFFFLNFHPHQSVSDYFVETPGGTYHHVLDSDSAEFGGLARIEQGQIYQVLQKREPGLRREGVRIYLPCRTALILRRSL